MTAARNARRRVGRPFLSLPLDMLAHPGFAALTPAAVKLLLSIARKFNGKNNGELDAPYGELISRWRFGSRHTIRRALHEVTAAGFLIRTRQGRRFGGTPQPSLYAITWQPIPASELHPYTARTAPRNWQVQNAGAPGALVKAKQVHSEHLRGSKTPFLDNPENEVMRVSQVHPDSEQVLPEHHLYRSMPYGMHTEMLAAIEALPADLLLSGCHFQKTARACIPIGGSSITPAQINASEYMADLVRRYCYFDIPLVARE